MSKMKLYEMKDLDTDEIKRLFKDKFKLEEDEIDGKLILKPTHRTIRELPKKTGGFFKVISRSKLY